jgi:cytochrome b subunit of formate dehydrogenase
MPNLLKILLKIDKNLSWLLLLMMLLFIISGYRLLGKYDTEKIMSMKTARYIHLSLDILLILLFLLHVGTHSYLKIFGFLKKRSKRG